MDSKVLNILENIFDKLSRFWDGRNAHRFFSNVLVLIFTGCLLISTANHFQLIDENSFFSSVNYLTAINFTFLVLLLIEMVSLVFVIPGSIANSIAKQFEILSLILLRTSFEEFTRIDLAGSAESEIGGILKMLADGFSALTVFALVNIYYKLQKHRKITGDLEEGKRFVLIKKIIALFLLVVMVVFGLNDLLYFVRTGLFRPSLNNFYLVLIYGDLLFMLIAFRFVIHYPDVFRYSSFVLITVFIRLSLTAPAYYSGMLAILTAVFALGVVYFHNAFIEERNKKIADSMK